jgi:hypothetical protein
MRWTRALPAAGALATAIVVSPATPAMAASVNIGWLYTFDREGKAYFDADANGEPGKEKIVVVDRRSDGHGVRARVWQAGNPNNYESVQDPKHDAARTVWVHNMFREGTPVYMQVCLYKGDWSGWCGETKSGLA